MEKVFSIIFAIGMSLLFVFLFAAVLSLPVMLLWNYCLVPAVTGLMPVGLFQSFGILILTSILFKSSTTKGK